jgi:hypothetical protein
MIDSAENVHVVFVRQPGFEHYDVKASIKNEIFIKIRITREVRYLR